MWNDVTKECINAWPTTTSIRFRPALKSNWEVWPVGGQNVLCIYSSNSHLILFAFHLLSIWPALDNHWPTHRQLLSSPRSSSSLKPCVICCSVRRRAAVLVDLSWANPTTGSTALIKGNSIGNHWTPDSLLPSRASNLQSQTKSIF